MARSGEVKLRDLGEDRLLKILLPNLPVGRNTVVGIGDDCAVVKAPGIGMILLLKTDCVVEGVHYHPNEEPARVGWKALCRTLSDVAAMGGEPLHALVTMLSPEDRRVAYWKSIYKGLSKAAKRFGVGIIGGETSRSRCAAISVAVVGRVEADRLVTRSGGRPKDILCVTGTLGGSLAGRHLDFVPRITEGRWLGKGRYARAMMDLSDGLAADLPRLAAASDCSFRIDVDAVPKARGCDSRRALSDGEDYELLIAVSPQVIKRLRQNWGKTFPKLQLTVIGELTEPGTPPVGIPPGFDHFLPRIDRQSQGNQEDVARKRRRHQGNDTSARDRRERVFGQSKE
jgi:thiamine-monophosphate kinase